MYLQSSFMSSKNADKKKAVRSRETDKKETVMGGVTCFITWKISPRIELNIKNKEVCRQDKQR